MESVADIDWEHVAEVIAYVITAATAITMITPTQADNKILNGILKALNIAAGNVFKNKNADDKE